MKKRESQITVKIVQLFREGKLDFSYRYNPLYTFEDYDRRDDHEFIAEYNSLSIRLGRRRVIVIDKEPQQTDRHFPSTVDFPLARELVAIYRELYRKHEAAINEVLEAQEDPNREPHDRGTQDRDRDATAILGKLSI